MSETATAPATRPDAGPTPARFRLLASCPDRPGVVAAVSRALFESGANILCSDQHSPARRDDGRLLRRLER